MKFVFYVVGRLLKDLFLLLTFPVWGPVVFVLWIAAEAFLGAHDWFTAVSKDWGRRP